jgi:hypothetical protein
LHADEAGICRAGGVSKNKGLACETHEDCPALDWNGDYTTAPCECSYNSDGQKYCGVLKGDKEWLDVTENFKNYHKATKDTCNTAARREECG